MTAVFLCTLVSGFLFSFAIVVMPGISNLTDRDFIKAFQEMDGVIQRNQPLFLLVWLGSAVSVAVAAGIGMSQLAGINRLVLVGSASVYWLAVQLPTIAINIPLNNKLQKIETESANDEEHHSVRKEFESRWVRWNLIRTLCACFVSISMMVVLLRI